MKAAAQKISGWAASCGQSGVVDRCCLVSSPCPLARLVCSVSRYSYIVSRGFSFVMRFQFVVVLSFGDRLIRLALSRTAAPGQRWQSVLQAGLSLLLHDLHFLASITSSVFTCSERVVHVAVESARKVFRLLAEILICRVCFHPHSCQPSLMLASSAYVRFLHLQSSLSLEDLVEAIISRCYSAGLQIHCNMLQRQAERSTFSVRSIQNAIMVGGLENVRSSVCYACRS